MYIKELQRIGLGDKEANVYIASLELGPDTAQNIAKKAGVGRPSTYVQIESLKKKGLMSQFEKDGKTFFVCESPDRLRSLTTRLEDELIDRKSTIEKIVPMLNDLSRISEDATTRVRLFDNEEALRGLHQEYLSANNGEMLSISSVEISGSDIKSKVIYTNEDAYKRGSNNATKLTQAKLVNLKDGGFSSTINIFDDKVEILSYNPKLVGIVINNKQIVNSFKSLFSELWGSSLEDSK